MFTGKFEDDKNAAITTEGNGIGPSPSVSQKSSKTQKSNEVESDDEDMIGPPLPPGLTKGSKTSEEEVEIGPPLPPSTSASKGSDDEDDEEDEPEEVCSYKVD